MKVVRLRVSNYRGIAACDHTISPAGAIAKGANRRGKTSLLRALRAALSAQDIGPDAIRLGADKAEIIVNMDDITVKRAITPSGSSLKVVQRGFEATKPQTFLRELLGSSPLDPLDLFLAKPKDRRAQVLASLPVTVTLEQLRKWAPSLPDDYDVDGHGLEVLERTRKMFYDQRTAANAAAAADEREASRLVGLLPAVSSLDAPDYDAAMLELDAATKANSRLHAERETSAAIQARTATQRERAAAFRAEAAAGREQAAAEDPPADLFAASAESLSAAEAEVAQLEKHLADARAGLQARRVHHSGLQLLVEKAKQLRAHAQLQENSAEEIERAIAAATVDLVTDEQLAKSSERSDAAFKAVKHAQAKRDELALREKVHEASRAAEATRAKADALDAIVKALANDAPAELMGSIEAAQGLTIDGEDVLLDGKRIEALSGEEQMRFAVQVAKRLNAKSKFLFVDGLERLDPEQLDAFVEMATDDGFQLIGTKVDKGEIVVEAIASDFL